MFDWVRLAIIRILGFSENTVPLSKKGWLYLQLDGVGYGVISKAIENGQMPFLRHLVKDRAFSLYPYTCGVPSMTPVTEAGLFFRKGGAYVPGFSFYHRELHTFFRADSPHFSLFEKTLSHNNPGLLTGGSCLFGAYDAGANFTRFSPAELDSHKALKLFLRLRMLLVPLLNPIRFWTIQWMLLLITMRTWARIVKRKSLKVFGQIFTDAFELILLGDLFCSLVRIELARKTPVLFVDFGVYDHAAHMYGLYSTEAKHSLRLLDAYCKIVYFSQKHSRRSYEVVIFSDHGQAPAEEFDVRYDTSVSQVVAGAFGLQPEDVIKTFTEVKKSNGQAPVIYCIPNSSYMHCYFHERLQGDPFTHKELDEKYPGCIRKLLDHPGLGWVVLRESKKRVSVVGKHGAILYENGKVIKKTGDIFSHVYDDTSDVIISRLGLFTTNIHNGDIVVFGNTLESGNTLSFEAGHMGSHGSFHPEMLGAFMMTNNDALGDVLKKKPAMEELFTAMRDIKDAS